ncbi:hypothetical protein BS50DRAFT_660284 [Corynespora cassiicola Philippines]|uniref:Uncharacterized protein n=1 Tax=Corynespora cassiicola Philippines TaxID=1448308 RepID=A0A2T2P1K4_CORCC|nr:hypothetical protein BS50DRAFT_660284 [Corynespora cassiicola Philippines]
MSTAAPPLLNGNGAASAEGPREAAFLERLMHIRDEVLASKHARIHLPPKLLEQVAPRPSSSRPTANGSLNGTNSTQTLSARPDNSLQYRTSSSELALTPHAPRPFSAKSGSSGIDPVLLQKSDNLIRAELQLKRQQVERLLKDELDRKTRVKDSSDDRETRLDVENLLAKAHDLVKPVSGLRAPVANSEGTESFDDSYYSSKADSWSPEMGDSHQNTTDAADQLMTPAKPASSQNQVTAPNSAARRDAHPQRVEPDVIDLDEEPYEPVDDIEIYEPEPATIHEDAEESDYSPPPADVGPSEPARARARGGQDNHPGTNNSSRRQSPVGQAAPIQNPRKRRRDDKERRREKNRRAERAERVERIRSPEPYIKEEPQSPPPFSSYPDGQPSKRRALQPLPSDDVEVVSAPEGSRLQPVYYKEQESSLRPHRQYEEPSSPTVIRMPQRRVEREDQDLRRVASVQYARRPYSPGAGDLYAAPEPRQIRAVSHAFVDRPMEQPVYREASARPSAAPRYVRERSRSPIHEYLPRAQSPMTMAPPPRRIVVDQWGNKYYAAPADVRESVAPTSRRIEVDPYFERAITREPTMRAPARAEVYEEDDMQRMPPPPPRRYVEAADAEAVENQVYRQRAASHRPVDIEYRPQEAMERRPVVQYEDMGPPREYLPSRAYSVRPEVVRREVPEGYTRHESVQPGHIRVAPRYREVSVVHPDAYDDRRYTFAAPQSRRYVEEGAERPVEAAQEPFGEARRVTYRY